MLGLDQSTWENLRNYSAIIFVFAALFRIINSVSSNLGQSTNWLLSTSFTLSYLLLFIGMISFYPSVSDEFPVVGKAGIMSGLIGIAGIAVAGVIIPAINLFIGRNIFAGPPANLQFLSFMSPLVFTMAIIGFTLFGVAGYKTDITLRRLSGLFLATPLGHLGFFLGIFTGSTIILITSTAILTISWLLVAYYLPNPMD